MQLKRLLGTATAVVALTGAAVMYSVHPAKSSDHQDTYNLANAVGHNPSADITDVFVYPAPDNANNVVLAMDTYPLIPAGTGSSKFFDPTIMWQFHISHGAITTPEDETFQIQATGTDASQVLTLYQKTTGAAGTTSTFTGSTALLSANYNTVTTSTTNGNTINFFAGPRADPFYFDLFGFFSFLGDRNFMTHSGQDAGGSGTPLSNGDNAPGSPATAADKGNNPSQPSFNGFAQGTTAGTGSALGNYACLTAPAQGALNDIGGGFDVLSYVIEVPKTMISSGSQSQSINVWATTSSSTTNT